MNFLPSVVKTSEEGPRTGSEGSLEKSEKTASIASSERPFSI